MVAATYQLVQKSNVSVTDKVSLVPPSDPLLK